MRESSISVQQSEEVSGTGATRCTSSTNMPMQSTETIQAIVCFEGMQPQCGAISGQDINLIVHDFMTLSCKQ